MTTHARMSRPSAYTLIEVVVTMAIMATVVIGLGSAFLLSARAAPAAGDPLGLAVDASKALEQISDEIASATLFELADPTRTRFLVADRDNDGTPERIEYAWSGVAGEPLTRSYNSGTAAVVLDEVDDCAFEYTIQSPSVWSGVYTREPEAVLWGIIGLSTFSVEATDTTWLGQSFVPSVSAGALGWFVTKIDLDLSGTGTATYAIEVRRYDAGVVSQEVFASAMVDLSRLGSYEQNNGFVTIDLGQQRLLAPDDEACVILYRVSGSDRMEWGLATALSAQGGTLLYSTNAGANWSTSTFSYRSMAVHGIEVAAGDDGVPADTISAVFVDLTPTRSTLPLRTGVRLPGEAIAP